MWVGWRRGLWASPGRWVFLVNDFPEFLAHGYLSLKLLLKSKAIPQKNTSRQNKGCAPEPLETGGHSPKLPTQEGDREVCLLVPFPDAHT